MRASRTSGSIRTKGGEPASDGGSATRFAAFAKRRVRVSFAANLTTQRRPARGRSTSKENTMSLIIHAGANAISYDELRAVYTPEGTETHIPVPHHEIEELMRYTLGFYGHEIMEEHHALTPEAPDTSACCPCAALMGTTRTQSACATAMTKASRSALPLVAALSCATTWPSLAIMS